MIRRTAIAALLVSLAFLTAASRPAGLNTRPTSLGVSTISGPKHWPGMRSGRHTYIAGFAPVHYTTDSAVIVGGTTGQWQNASEAAQAWIDSVAEGWDMMILPDLRVTDWIALADSVRARTVHPKILCGYPFHLIFDYGNGSTLRRPPADDGHALGRLMYDALYPDHVMLLSPTLNGGGAEAQAYFNAYGDTAAGAWSADYQYIINWSDPEVPAVMADVYADFLALDLGYDPDGIFLDWLEWVNGDTWWQPWPTGYYMDGDGDGVTGNADAGERLATYTNWGEFFRIFQKRMGKEFIVTSNAGLAYGPLDASAVLANGKLSISKYSFPMIEHWPQYWGGDTTDYVQDAFLTGDSETFLGFDSFRQWLTGTHRPANVHNRHTESGGYVCLWNKMRANWPYVSIISLYMDGAIAFAGPYWDPNNNSDFVDEPRYFTNPMNRLRELGAAVGPPTETGGVWERKFDSGVVKIEFNETARMVHWIGSSGHSANPGGPFKYIAIKDPDDAAPDTLYRGGGWPRQEDLGGPDTDPPLVALSPAAYDSLGVGGKIRVRAKAVSDEAAKFRFWMVKEDTVLVSAWTDPETPAGDSTGIIFDTGDAPVNNEAYKIVARAKDATGNVSDPDTADADVQRAPASSAQDTVIYVFVASGTTGFTAGGDSVHVDYGPITAFDEHKTYKGQRSRVITGQKYQAAVSCSTAADTTQEGTSTLNCVFRSGPPFQDGDADVFGLLWFGAAVKDSLAGATVLDADLYVHYNTAVPSGTAYYIACTAVGMYTWNVSNGGANYNYADASASLAWSPALSGYSAWADFGPSTTVVGYTAAGERTRVPFTTPSESWDGSASYAGVVMVSGTHTSNDTAFISHFTVATATMRPLLVVKAVKPWAS